MNRRVYTLLYYALLPFIFLRLLWRARRAPDYAKRWPERLGYFKAPAQRGGLWLHSVSVGETIAAAPLIKQIQAAYPTLPITITTMTPTGSARVRALFDASVFHVYVPYDMPGAVRRFLARVQPQVLLIMETELWPNLIHCAHQQGVHCFVLNARLSERSARGYQRFARLTQDMLTKLTGLFAQTHADAQRLIGIGAPAERVQISGNVKYDLKVAEDLTERAQTLRAEWGNARPVWIAASTHAGEDEQVLAAHREILKDQSDALLLLVPRHPERFETVAQLCAQQGFSTARRSKGEAVTDAVQVMLGDTMGELMLFYATADVAFVGGSLVPTGGHNYLEPAALGLPVLSGPHRFNFTEVSSLLMAVGALREVAGAQQLATAVLAWFEPVERSKAGVAGRQVVEDNRGAQQRVFEALRAQLSALN